LEIGPLGWVITAFILYCGIGVLYSPTTLISAGTCLMWAVVFLLYLAVGNVPRIGDILYTGNSADNPGHHRHDKQRRIEAMSVAEDIDHRHIKQKHHRPHQTGARADQGVGLYSTPIPQYRINAVITQPSGPIFSRRPQRRASIPAVSNDSTARTGAIYSGNSGTAMANRIDSRHGLLALWENLSRRVNAPAVRSDMLSPPFRRAVFGSRRIQLPVCRCLPRHIINLRDEPNPALSRSGPSKKI